MTETTIWEMLASTPWWVFVLYLYLFRLGIFATKARIVSVKKIFILPALLLILTFISLRTIIDWDLQNITIWIVALLIGTFFGWLQFQSLKIKAIKNTDGLYVPGTWSLLIIIPIILVVQYYSNYGSIIDPNIFKQGKNAFLLLILYGFFSGLFIGRLALAMRYLKHGPFVSALDCQKLDL